MSLNKDFSAVNSGRNTVQRKTSFKEACQEAASEESWLNSEHYTEGRNDCKKRTEATKNRMKWKKDDP